MSTFQTRRRSSLFNTNKTNKTQQQQNFDEIIEKNRLIGKEGKLKEPPTISSSDDETDSSDEEFENEENESGYYYQPDDETEDEEDLLEKPTAEIDSSTPLIIEPDLKVFWVGVMIAMMIAIAMNMVCIWLIISSWDRNNSANHLIDLVNTNITNANSNNNSDCMSCYHNIDTDEYTTSINAIMNLDVNSEIITQFDTSGIIMDNMFFTELGVFSNNINTSILFENNLEASNMLISSTPGLISVPLETSSSLSSIGNCPSPDNLVPSIYAYKKLPIFPATDPEYYICFCNSNNKYCHILTQTV